MSQTLSGRVDRVSLYPGRPDLLTVDFSEPDRGVRHAMFSAAEGDGVVTFDGQAATLAELFALLAQAPAVDVVVHPDPQRYGLSEKTEFHTHRGEA